MVNYRYRKTVVLVLLFLLANSTSGEGTFVGLPPPAELKDILKQNTNIGDSESADAALEGNAISGTQYQETRILKVGPGEKYRLPSMAASVARDGDSILIDARGNYAGDEVIWSNNDLTIKGVGGKPVISKNEIKNQKALWVIQGNNITIENIEFTGAKVQDGNGAGIRLEGKNLDIRYCYFHNNENGILAGDNRNSTVSIEYNEFANNGAGDGKTHNIYIGRIDKLIARFNYIHHAIVGHNLKSRARVNHILFNRIMDEKDGSASYQIDIPNGGLSYIVGNTIQQGKRSENWSILAFGLEGMEYKRNQLFLINNTIVNDRKDGVFLNSDQTAELLIVNNLFVGTGKFPDRQSVGRHNLVTKNPGFVNRGAYNYKLRPNSIAIDKGIQYNSIGVKVDFEYAHKAKAMIRSINGKIDHGAYEFHP